MGVARREDVRNLAIIAHVDHGKTSLVDAMLWQSGLFRECDHVPERVLRAIDPRREKTVTVMPRVVAVPYRGARIHIFDTPGHADLGGDVERVLRVVDGFVFVVDAAEGPLPQSRFVLRRALENGLRPLVLINKIDLPRARAAEVRREVHELFVDLDASASQRDFPVLYGNARLGVCRRAPGGADEPLLPLFDLMLETVPPPTHDPDVPLQLQIAFLDYDDLAGRVAVGRMVSGELSAGQEVAHARPDGGVVPARISQLWGYEGLRRVGTDRAAAGDVVAVGGVESVAPGSTICDAERPRPLPPVHLDEPTICVEIGANDSPFAGLDGQYVTARRLRERLFRELLSNPSVRVEEIAGREVFRVSVRGELQIAILLEMMRREGYEMSVGRPEILTRDVDGERHEPIETLILDCPEAFVGAVSQKVAARKGRLTQMIDHGTGRVRMEFRIPSRGLLGFRGDYLSDTRGTGIMNHVFLGYEPWQGEIPHRRAGALVSDHAGRATAWAIEHLQGRGSMFVSPGEQVYEGMIVGESPRPVDVDVNVTRERRKSPALLDSTEESVRLVPARSLSLEQALGFINEDEVVEVTPRAVRLRKRSIQTYRGTP